MTTVRNLDERSDSWETTPLRMPEPPQPVCTFIVPRAALLEADAHRFVIEASDCGWPAGKWPRGFSVEGMVRGRPFGNGMPFRYVSVDRDQEGDLRSVTYQQLWGCVTIRVFND